MTQKPSRLGAFARLVVKDHGAVAGRATTRTLPDRWLTSGSLSMDAALGGGARIGNILMLFGDKSGGKTTTAKRLVAAGQRLCRNCYREARCDDWDIQVAELFDHPKFVLRAGEDDLLDAYSTKSDAESAAQALLTSGAAKVAVIKVDDVPVAELEFEDLLVTEDGEVVPTTRIQAHDNMIGRGAELVASSGDDIYYATARQLYLVRHRRGWPTALAPNAEDLADLGEDARWSGSGWCDCFVSKVYFDEPEKKGGSEKMAAFRERVDRWTLEMNLNSYQEFVVVWLDMEESFHPMYARNLGVDSDRVYFIRPTNAEEAIDICHGICLTGEIDMLVIDSIAQLVPQKEISASMEEWQQGLQARLVNKAARKIMQSLTVASNRKRPITQIWINQSREKIGVMFGDPTVKPGGKGQEYAMHAEIKFGQAKVKTFDDQYGSKEEVTKVPIEETFKFTVTKNKTASTKGSSGFYTQTMRETSRGPVGTIIEDEHVFKLAMHHLCASDKKKGTYTIGAYEFTSQKEILVQLRDDREFFLTVRAALLTRMLTGTGMGSSSGSEGEGASASAD